MNSSMTTEQMDEINCHSRDMKELVGIGVLEQNFDDVQTWISELVTKDVVDESDLILFPQLDRPQVADDLSNNLFEEFVDIDALDVGDTISVPDDANLSNVDNLINQSGGFMAEKLDFSELYKLDTQEIDDEVCFAAKLLSEEENEFADLLISYIENDSVVSSPEINNESVDILLDNLTGDTSTPHVSVYNDNEKTVDVAATEIDFLTEILAENNTVISIEQIVDTSTSTVNCNIDFPEDLNIDENVVNEFADLLNSLDDGLANWDEGQNASFSNPNASSVDYVNAYVSANLYNNFEDSLIPFANEETNAEQTFATIDNSLISPTNSICSSVINNGENIQTTTEPVENVNKLKRKHSSVSSDELPADKITLRRDKNNKASKVTRAKRKSRHQNLYEQERELLESNAELRIKAEVMQKEADILRQLLVVALSNANC